MLPTRNYKEPLKYLPTVKTICEENELPWERYATMYDRALWYDKKPQDMARIHNITKKHKKKNYTRWKMHHRLIGGEKRLA